MRETKLYCALAILLLGSMRLAGAAELGELETRDFRLLYFDTTQTYLTPHAAISFHNSLERQRSIFGYEPDERITVLLKDFSDYANAKAMGNADFASALSNADFARALGNADFARALGNAQFARALGNAQFASDLASRQFAQD